MIVGYAYRMKILIPISGGKDSQACLKLATRQYPASEIRGLFCDTQFEHPVTYAHVETLRTLYGDVRIDTVTGGSVLEKCLKYGRLPVGGARHCTEELKIWETKRYCRREAEALGHGFEVWYGMRGGESPARRKRYLDKIPDEVYPPHEVLRGKYPKYLAKMGVMFRLPILEWTTAEVLEFLGGEENPLYRPGEDHPAFDRVGCFPCLASGDRHKEKAFFESGEFGRQQYERVLHLTSLIGKPVWESKRGQQQHGAESTDSYSGCSICAM